MLTLHLALAALAMQVPEQPETPPVCVGWGLLFFERGSADVTPASAGILDNFTILLRRGSVMSRVTIIGYADREGGDAANLRLSLRRARAVAAYLVAKGIPRRLLTAEGRGETRLHVETADGIPEPQNRYVSYEEQVDPAEMARRNAIWARIGRPTIVC